MHFFYILASVPLKVDSLNAQIQSQNDTLLGKRTLGRFFLAGNSVFWRKTPSVNIVSTASYKMNHNAAIRKQMWLTFLTVTD